MELQINKRRAISGGIIGFIGYMLSPLSWWNDMFVNFPLAYAGAWLVSFFFKPAFGAAFVGFYWLTNILGFFMMHKGVSQIVTKDSKTKSYGKSGLQRDLLLAFAYTIAIIVLIKYDFIQPIWSLL